MNLVCVWILFYEPCMCLDLVLLTLYVFGSCFMNLVCVWILFYEPCMCLDPVL